MRRAAAGSLITVLCLCSNGAAQGVPDVRLGPPESTSSQQFSGITSVREISDGRLLIADRVEQVLYVLDWQTGRANAIGRSGQGPGEYNGAGWLYPLRADSTLFIEWPFTRRHIMKADRIVTTRPPAEDFGGLRSLQIEGSDTASRILGVVGVFGPGSRLTTPSSADSVMLLLIDRAAQNVDTVARMKGRGGVGRNIQRPSGGRPGRLILSNPLVSEEQAALFPDGWIAVAHLEPYRVDWRSPAGRWVRGSPLPFDAVQVDLKQKCTVIERVLGTPVGDCDPSFLIDWPEIVPAFLPTLKMHTLLTASDGNLVITRTPVAAITGTMYDIVDRQGHLAGRMQLPSGETLVGFGPHSAYVSVTDELGLQTLRRHAWPTHSGG